MKKLIFLFATICITVSSFAYPRIHVGLEHVNPNALGWDVQQYAMNITWVNVTGSTLNWFAEAYFGPSNWYNTAPPSGFEMMAAGHIGAYKSGVSKQLGGTNGFYGAPSPKYGQYVNINGWGQLSPIGYIMVKGVKSHGYGDVYMDLSW